MKLQNRSIRLAIVLVVCACSPYLTLKSQTYFSRVSSPAVNTDYSYSVNGICIGCYVHNPSYAATMQTTDSTRMRMTVGVANEIVFRLKLSDTANKTAGVLVSNNVGLLNLSLLDAITLKTYYKGVLQETFSGGSVLSLSLLQGSKYRIEASTTKKFNEVQFEISNVVSALWDMNLFYAYGTTSLVGLPVRLVSFDASLRKDNQAELHWSAVDETSCKGYYILHSADGVRFQKLSYIPSGSLKNSVNDYTYMHQLTERGRHFYKITAVNTDGTEGTNCPASSVMYDPGVILTLYPSPANDVLNISLKEPASTVEILDRNGKLVHQHTCDPGMLQSIDIRGFSSGYYIVMITNESGQSDMVKFSKL
jgi:hypothetical protein